METMPEGGGLINRVHTFLMAPLSSSPRDLLLIVGLVIIFVALWTRVLRSIQDMV